MCFVREWNIVGIIIPPDIVNGAWAHVGTNDNQKFKINTIWQPEIHNSTSVDKQEYTTMIHWQNWHGSDLTGGVGGLSTKKVNPEKRPSCHIMFPLVLFCLGRSKAIFVQSSWANGGIGLVGHECVLCSLLYKLPLSVKHLWQLWVKLHIHFALDLTLSYSFTATLLSSLHPSISCPLPNTTVTASDARYIYFTFITSHLCLRSILPCLAVWKWSTSHHKPKVRWSDSFK